MKARNKKGQFFRGCAGIRKTHGGSETPLYGVWLSMRSRCNRPTDWSYARYGGRGITVCRDWSKFEAFRLWATTNGYRKGLSLDRRNNSRGYSPSNCHWTTGKSQGRNKRNNRVIRTPRGKMVLSAAAEISGLAPEVLVNRIAYGWPISKLFEPKGYRHWNRWRPRPSAAA